MVQLGVYPPQGELLQEIASIANVSMGPTMLVTQTGPEGNSGPDQAGAILILNATFSDNEKAQGFWQATIPLFHLLAEAKGFIRRFTFVDPPNFYLIALWRTIEDARAFASSKEHRAATRELYKQRWQYTHFAGLWQMAGQYDRMVFCERCDGVTPISIGVCSSCGVTLDDA